VVDSIITTTEKPHPDATHPTSPRAPRGGNKANGDSPCISCRQVTKEPWRRSSGIRTCLLCSIARTSRRLFAAYTSESTGPAKLSVDAVSSHERTGPRATAETWHRRLIADRWRIPYQEIARCANCIVRIGGSRAGWATIGWVIQLVDRAVGNSSNIIWSPIVVSAATLTTSILGEIVVATAGRQNGQRG
jgi:hypothetical protein